jgi:tetratricopeptide (TPR) repeat protein
MRRIDLTRCLGMALVVWGVLAVAGCQQVPLNQAPPSHKPANDSPPAQANLTAAQQADMQVAIGRVTENQGDLAAAMNAYREALKRDQNSAEAHARMAVLHDKQGEFRESAELFRKALKLSPGNPDIYCDMGYSLYLQRRWAEAEMNLRQAIAVSPNFARAHNNLALVLARDTRVDDALAEFQKAGSDEATAHANVAFVLTMENRWDDARKQYQLALAANPSSTEIKDRLEQLDHLVAKVEPRRAVGPVTKDERLVTASAQIDQPPSQPTAQVAAPGAQPPRIRATEPSFSQRRMTSPFDLAAREASYRNTDRADTQPVAPAPDTSEAPAPVQVATSSQPVAPIPAPTTVKAPEPVEVGNVQPRRRIPEPRRYPAPATVERASGQPRSHIPPPRKLQAPETDHPYGNRPEESSKTAIPPPRTWVTPAQPQADESADAPSPVPVTINLSKPD